MIRLWSSSFAVTAGFAGQGGSSGAAYADVYKDAAPETAGAISVLAPVGTALLGYATGDIVEWPVPSGMRRLRIEEILYQPESAGDFHL